VKVIFLNKKIQFNLNINSDQVNKYFKAVDHYEKNSTEKESLPFLYLLSISIKTILDRFNFPSGTIHMAQTLSNLAVQDITESSYVANAEIIQENQRTNAIVLKVAFNIEKKGFGNIVKGSTTLMIPE
tara:strand:+ start:623 stop:1006 length:384 start_codon:yes stop_codon:yes gene_type:complete